MMRAIYNRFEGMFAWKRGWSMVYLPENEAAWAIVNHNNGVTAIRRRNSVSSDENWTEETQEYAKHETEYSVNNYANPGESKLSTDRRPKAKVDNNIRDPPTILDECCGFSESGSQANFCSVSESKYHPRRPKGCLSQVGRDGATRYWKIPSS